MSNKRTLVLVKEDKFKDSGLLDPGLFDGKNSLNCIADSMTGMWSFKYEHGITPPALREKFTSFKIAKAYAEEYFKTKKIKIVDVRY